MHRILLRNTKKQSLMRQSFKFCSTSENLQQEQDMFYQAFAHTRNQDLDENSPIRTLMDNSRDIEKMRKVNEFIANPLKYFNNEKSVFQQELGENFESFYNRGLKFDVKGLKNESQQQGQVKVALFQNEHGNSELRLNQDDISQLENTTYLDFLKQNEVSQNIQHTVSKNEHFSFCLENYVADEYVDKLQENQVIFFNLPKNTTKDSLTKQLQQLELGVENVQIKECLVGLPAFAIIDLQSQEQVAKALDLNTSQYLQDNLINVRSKRDNIKENSSNRTLVIQGFSPATEIQEILQKLSLYGRVMHLELVEENVNPTLPTQKEVIEFLKENLLQQNFQIVEISQGTGQSSNGETISRQEQELYQPRQNQEYQNVGDLESAKQKLEQQKQNQIIDKISEKTTLYTLKWCNTLEASNKNEQLKNTSEKLNDIEIVYEYLSPQEKEEIKQKIQNQKEFQNLGYCFVTYASSDSAKYAYGNLQTKSFTSFPNEAIPFKPQFDCNWENISVFLKNESDHYYYDADHLLNRFIDISSQYKRAQHTFTQGDTDAKSLELLQKKHQEIKQELIEQQSSVQVSRNIEEVLKNEVLAKKSDDFEVRDNYNLESVGRDFSKSISVEEQIEFRNKIQQDIDEKYRDQLQTRELDLKNLEQFYSNKLKSIGYDNIVDPLRELSSAEKKKVISALQDQQNLKILEDLQAQDQEAVRMKNFRDDANFQLKMVQSKKELLQKQQQRVKDKKTRKEQRLAEQSGAEFSAVTRNIKHKGYSKFVNDLKNMIAGDFESELRESLFARNDKAFGQCKDNVGDLYYDEHEADRIFQYQLPRDKQQRQEILQRLENHKNMIKIMPQQWVENLENISHSEKNQVVDMQQKYGVPIESFEIEEIPEGKTIEQYIHELNQFAAELGEEYHLQEIKEENKQVIVKVLKPLQTPKLENVLGDNVNSENIDEIQKQSLQSMQPKLLNEFMELGLSQQEAEQEVIYFYKHQDYSENIYAILDDASLEDLTEEEIEEICAQEGLSRQEVEMLLNMGDEQSTRMALNSLAGQIQQLQSDKLQGTITKEDIVKSGQQRVKDEKDQYIGSTFKQI